MCDNMTINLLVFTDRFAACYQASSAECSHKCWCWYCRSCFQNKKEALYDWGILRNCYFM